MKAGYWRRIAREVISTAVKDAERRELDRAATIALIDAAYPFGERAYYPYKVWLEERRRVLNPVTEAAEKVVPTITHGLKRVPELDEWLRSRSA